MKKLMIAAAAAAMIGGAYAAGDYQAVYNLKYSLKTIQPKKYSCGKDSSTCTICEKSETKAKKAYYYENGTATIEGLLAYCATCDEIGESYTNKAILALWDSKNKETIYFDSSWANVDLVDDVKNSAVSNVFSKIDSVIYGKSSTKVAVDTKIQYAKGKSVKRAYLTFDEVSELTYDLDWVYVDRVWDLRATGLGTYAWKNNSGYIKSVSGNVAGLIPAYTGYEGSAASGYYWSALVLDDICDGAVKYACTSAGKLDNSVIYNAVTPAWDWEDEINDKDVRGVDKADVVPAYGTWTMKYNSGALTNKKGIKGALPSWLYNKYHY